MVYPLAMAARNIAQSAVAIATDNNSKQLAKLTKSIADKMIVLVPDYDLGGKVLSELMTMLFSARERNDGHAKAFTPSPNRYTWLAYVFSVSCAIIYCTKLRLHSPTTHDYDRNVIFCKKCGTAARPKNSKRPSNIHET